VQLLTNYISYARNSVTPTLSQEASKELVNSYVEMRKLGEDIRASERRITATTRQLESMIRLSEAHAKMRLAESVTVSDVKEAARLIRTAIAEYATDPVTGRIDMDLINTGQSSGDRRQRRDLQRELVAIVEQLGQSGAPVRYMDVFKQINDQSSVPLEQTEFAETLRQLETEGYVVITGDGPRRVIRKVVGGIL
jgi:DNA replication licensing factor MCM4